MFENYDWFKERVLKLTSIDLNAYKERQMKRRIDALISRNSMDNYSDYLMLLTNNKEVLKQFVNYLTINVSEFFRNPDQWKIFEEMILKEMLTRKKRLRIWSAACSTGDEPYTIAMILQNYLNPSQFEIIATDIDDQVLEKAQNGLYSSKSISGVPDKYMKYFTQINQKTYQISDSIIKMIKFKQHNLLLDRYISDCDIIVCRNVLIYFTDDAKNSIYQKFNDALVDNGVLFIGNTEQIITPKAFGFVSRKSFFYIKSDE